MELLTSETWRDIPNYEGLYQVSSIGNIRSLDREIRAGCRWKGTKPAKIRGRNIVATPNIKKGYLTVCLYKAGKYRRFSVHRLVAAAFIPNPYGHPCINHKNEICTDNRIENLEWCSYRYNNNYGTHTQRMRKTKSKPVLCYDSNGNFLMRFNSSLEAGDFFGVTRDAIFKNILHGSKNRKTNCSFKYE